MLEETRHWDCETAPYAYGSGSKGLNALKDEGAYFFG